ncbi:MAG: TIGR02266 family protein [Deltaproteobacteria bacterium]|nr:TIGR02266 family protein [Deltaproteobacteria bacterium]
MERSGMYNIAIEETYHDGQIIFKEGSSGDWVYIIISGSVEISKTVGGEKYIIEILKEGEVFGELGFIGGIKRTATARAQGVTTLGIIDREFLDKEFNKLSAQFRTILVSITYRFKKMLERACEYTSRTEARIPKALTLSFKDRDAFIRAYTGNISAGGLFIKTENPLGPGRQFQLKLQLPGVEKAIQVKCEVVWSRKRESSTPEKPSGMGVKFSEIAEKDYKLIKRYLESPNV